MRRIVAIAGAAGLLSGVCSGSEPAACQLRKGLYEERLVLASPRARPAAADSPGRSAGSPLDPKQEAIDAEYYSFLQALSEASEDKDPTALRVCCDAAIGDRIGSLSCQLVSYLAAGRRDSQAFLSAIPGNRREIDILWELDGIAARAVENGKTVPKAFLPNGPSRRLIQELFLLVLDGREEAIVKYFTLATNASEEKVPYMDGQIKIFIREAPSVMVNSWFVLRRYKQKLRGVIQSLAATATPAEKQQITRNIRRSCTSDDPDCQEILRMFPWRP